MEIKLKSGLLIRNVAGEKVLLSTGKANLDFSRILVLNESAALLIEELISGVPVRIDDLIKLLLKHYDVEYDRVKADVEELVSDLDKLNMLEKV